MEAELSLIEIRCSIVDELSAELILLSGTTTFENREASIQDEFPQAEQVENEKWLSAKKLTLHALLRTIILTFGISHTNTSSLSFFVSSLPAISENLRAFLVLL